MISITKAEELIKSLNVKSVLEDLSDRTKFTLVLNEKENCTFMITIPKEENTESEKDCVFSCFVDGDLLFNNTGVFTDVFEALKDYLTYKNL